MTKAACNLVLNVTKICLSWRSIKSLKRLGKSQNEGKISTVDYNGDCNNDLEILQLWSLIAFLTIYEQSGIERVISFFPLYYYFKMIIMIITAIPSTKFPDFWCELLLVPMMKKFHELMDLDWKTFLEREVVLLPWRILDLTILPGVFCDDLLLEEVKLRRLMQIQKAIEDGNDGGFGNGRCYDDDETEQIHEGKDDVDNTNADSEDDIGIDNIEGDEGSITETAPIDLNTIDEQSKLLIQTSPKEGPTHSPSKSPSPRSSKSTPKQKQPQNRKTPATSTRRQTSITSPVARSRVAASSLHLRKFSRDHKPSSGLLRETKAMTMRNKKDGVSPGKQRITSPGKGRTKTASTRSNATTRSRVKAPPRSAFQRTKVSPTKEKSPKTKADPNENDERESTEKDTFHTLIDETDNDDDSYGDEMRGRDSLGNRLRNFITGDTNIRIRDYLFDLDLPAAPSRDSTMGISKTFDNDHELDADREDFEPNKSNQRKNRVDKNSSTVKKREHGQKHALRRRTTTQANQKTASRGTDSATSNVTLRRSQRIAGKK
eukprot:CAMPEP_0203680872 /NCGR_PEP_ID=MMETSP0090-20130426/40926_1 /ASSEMBLY_ACC=CAM_ASM_001088 /TAXON_ID=426623 /ORGANISM="Chaetoceros affinis, Strain CCMP159" /LENGTH=545 /DNA_ID=CAMNT_0050549145 /DNA_START=18 /DNA_END=1655 /DNA_ORIENTATION=+